MRVVGLDLSIASTGLAHIDGTLETIEPKTKGDRRLLEVAERINRECFDPIDLVVIEDFVVRSASASVLGMLHGVVRVELMRDGLPYLTVPPATLKVYATGKGNAQKPDMRMELYKRTGVDVPDNDQVDAAWLRFLGLDLVGEPAFDLPQTHRRALDKLTLPEMPGVCSGRGVLSHG